ncbi:MAG: MATE family efflux transporter [Rikenellaceae bacterium]|nr:MATE family efflux transporter [Rikenellaceae bacterium]MCL2692483.1 MATE family efflux transporter [Rikenellaceae bacterium]
MDFSYKNIWTITYPVLISLVMEHLLGMTDAIFMGRVGEVEFGASGLGTIYHMVLYMFGLGFGVGVQILMARRNGQQQYKHIGLIFHQGMMIMMVLAAVLLLFSYFFSPVLLRSFITSEAVCDATLSYVRWRSYGFFFSFGVIMYRAYFMALTKTRILTLNGIVMVLSSVALNYVLIFGRFGFPAMGIAGAALGSSIAGLISLALMVVYTRYYTDYQYYGMFRWTRPSWSVLRQIFNVSSWTMLQYFLSCGTWLFFFLAIEHMGERALAASNLARQVSSLLFIFTIAFATTGSSMVSNLMGAQKQDEVMPLCLRIVKMSVLCVLPLFLFAAIFPSLFLRIYSNNAELIAASLPSMYVMLIAIPFGVVGFIYFLAISGTGNTRDAMWIETGILIVYIIMTYYLAFRIATDVAHVWLVEVLYGVSMLAVSLLYMKKARWHEKQI